MVKNNLPSVRSNPIRAVGRLSVSAGHSVEKKFLTKFRANIWARLLQSVDEISSNDLSLKLEAGNTKGGSITVPLTSSLTGLD
jgi:hypothetical protein